MVAVLVTNHGWDRAAGDRSASHWLAEALARAGWPVAFVQVHPRAHTTTPDEAERLQVFETRPGAVRAVAVECPGRESLRSTRRSRFLARVIRRDHAPGDFGRLLPAIRAAEVLIFDSGRPLLLVEAFRSINRHARLVYRMSDPLDTLPIPPRVRVAERRALPLFDLVSVPSQAMYQRVAAIPTARLQPHGVELAAFEGPTESPYQPGSRNAVYTGMHNLDTEFIERAARLRPDVTFHLLGPWQAVAPGFPNVVAHGVISFDETVPFIQHADIGLHCLVPPGGFDAAFSDTPKVMQYSACHLPIMAPSAIPSTRPNVFAFGRGDDASIGRALANALTFDRAHFRPEGIRSWDELAAELAGVV